MDFLIECIKQGKTQEDIAKELGLIATTSINYYIKNRGYTWAKLKEEVTGHKHYSIDDLGGLDFLIKCIKEGKTQKEITTEFGLGVNSIRNYLKKCGHSWTQLKKEVNSE